MKFRHSLALASAMALAAGQTAHAQSGSSAADLVEAMSEIQERQVNELFSSVTELAVTYLVMVGRTAVNFTYESMNADVRTNELVIDGISLYPDLPYAEPGSCEVKIGRIFSGGSAFLEFTTLEGTLQITDVEVPASCLPPQQAGMMAQFGYTDGIKAPAMTLRYSYHVPSAAADISVQASIVDAAEVTMDVKLDYLWFTGLFDYGDPVPVIRLDSAEVQIENRGIFERVEPLLAAQLGDLNALPPMAQGMLTDMLSQGGAAPLSAEQQMFVDNVASELGRFIQNKDRIVISSKANGLLLDDNLFDTPQAMIAALQPRLSVAPMAAESMIPPSMLGSALSGGGDMEDGARLTAGEALITGVGAPKAVAQGIMLLEPMAVDWHGEAALMSAEGLSELGADVEAYGMALRAMAAGASGAIALADDIEGDLSAGEILDAQEEAVTANPDSTQRDADDRLLLEAGNVSGMRERAMAATSGQGAVRSYVTAYMYASLAAAAGDESAAALRDRIDARFGDDDDWAAARDAVAAEALEMWAGGLAATVAGNYGMAQ